MRESAESRAAHGIGNVYPLPRSLCPAVLRQIGRRRFGSRFGGRRGRVLRSGDILLCRDVLRTLCRRRKIGGNVVAIEVAGRRGGVCRRVRNDLFRAFGIGDVFLRLRIKIRVIGSGLFLLHGLCRGSRRFLRLRRGSALGGKLMPFGNFIVRTAEVFRILFAAGGVSVRIVEIGIFVEDPVGSIAAVRSRFCGTGRTGRARRR